MARRNYAVRVDGNGLTRYFIDGAQVDIDVYVAEFYKDYGAVPSDANIPLTARQEVDNAGQSVEATVSSDFAPVEAIDASNPGSVTTLPDTQLN